MNSQKEYIMKRTLIISLLVAAIGVMTFVGCEKDEPIGQSDSTILQFPNRTDYLVESISWFQDSTNYNNTVYEYDDMNRLVRRVITGKIFEAYSTRDFTIVSDYIYTDGKVSSIITSDSSNNSTYTNYFFYDDYGRLIRAGNECFAYRNGRMDSIYYYNGDPNVYSILEYDAQGNVVQQIMHYPEYNGYEEPTGKYLIRKYNFEYGTGIRPDFGLDYLFGYEPTPGQGDAYPISVRMLSPNCMTDYSAGPEIWEYEYNEHGLPETMYYQFADVVPLNHPVYRFTYRHK